jgi:hypothetical protein
MCDIGQSYARLDLWLTCLARSDSGMQGKVGG